MKKTTVLYPFTLVVSFALIACGGGAGEADAQPPVANTSPSSQ